MSEMAIENETNFIETFPIHFQAFCCDTCWRTRKIKLDNAGIQGRSCPLVSGSGRVRQSRNYVRFHK